MRYIPLKNQPNVSRTRLESTSPSLRIDGRGFPHIAWLEGAEGHNELHYSFWDGLKWSYKGTPKVYISEQEITYSPDSLVLNPYEDPILIFSRRTGNGSKLALASYSDKWDFNELDVSYDVGWIGVNRYDRNVNFSSSSSTFFISLFTWPSITVNVVFSLGFNLIMLLKHPMVSSP